MILLKEIILVYFSFVIFNNGSTIDSIANRFCFIFLLTDIFNVIIYLNSFFFYLNVALDNELSYKLNSLWYIHNAYIWVLIPYHFSFFVFVFHYFYVFHFLYVASSVLDIHIYNYNIHNNILR